MTTEEFEKRQAEMSDQELIELAQKQVSDLARTGGRTFLMCVPPMITDTDMILGEIIRRFKILTRHSALPGTNGYDLGSVIKQEIKKQGLTQKKVAELMGISTNAISQICIGDTYPGKATLDKLCKVLKVKIKFSIENDWEVK